LHSSSEVSLPALNMKTQSIHKSQEYTPRKSAEERAAERELKKEQQQLVNTSASSTTTSADNDDTIIKTVAATKRKDKGVMNISQQMLIFVVFTCQ
jgi:hypothetical protein